MCSLANISLCGSCNKGYKLYRGRCEPQNVDSERSEQFISFETDLDFQDLELKYLLQKMDSRLYVHTTFISNEIRLDTFFDPRWRKRMSLTLKSNKNRMDFIHMVIGMSMRICQMRNSSLDPMFFVYVNPFSGSHSEGWNMPFGEFGYPRWEKIRLQNSQCYNWTLLLGNRWKTFFETVHIYLRSRTRLPTLLRNETGQGPVDLSDPSKRQFYIKISDVQVFGYSLRFNADLLRSAVQQVNQSYTQGGQFYSSSSVMLLLLDIRDRINRLAPPVAPGKPQLDLFSCMLKHRLKLTNSEIIRVNHALDLYNTEILKQSDQMTAKLCIESLDQMQLPVILRTSNAGNTGSYAAENMQLKIQGPRSLFRDLWICLNSSLSLCYFTFQMAGGSGKASGIHVSLRAACISSTLMPYAGFANSLSPGMAKALAAAFLHGDEGSLCPKDEECPCSQFSLPASSLHSSFNIYLLLQVFHHYPNLEQMLISHGLHGQKPVIDEVSSTYFEICSDIKEDAHRQARSAAKKPFANLLAGLHPLTCLSPLDKKPDSEDSGQEGSREDWMDQNLRMQDGKVGNPSVLQKVHSSTNSLWHTEEADRWFILDGTAVAELLRVAGNPHNLLARGNNNDCGDSSVILTRKVKEAFGLEEGKTDRERTKDLLTDTYTWDIASVHAIFNPTGGFCRTRLKLTGFHLILKRRSSTGTKSSDNETRAATSNFAKVCCKEALKEMESEPQHVARKQQLGCGWRDENSAGYLVTSESGEAKLAPRGRLTASNEQQFIEPAAPDMISSEDVKLNYITITRQPEAGFCLEEYLKASGEGVLLGKDWQGPSSCSLAKIQPAGTTFLFSKL
ncbi:hypothetical protein GH733_011287 [Mirounga leonina]|nr:hypothetical protein GH733_011287 [Mirounga leonina]